MSRKYHNIKKKGRKLYPEIELFRAPLESSSPEERFQHAADKIYRGWDKRDKK